MSPRCAVRQPGDCRSGCRCFPVESPVLDDAMKRSGPRYLPTLTALVRDTLPRLNSSAGPRCLLPAVTFVDAPEAPSRSENRCGDGAEPGVAPGGWPTSGPCAAAPCGSALPGVTGADTRPPAGFSA